MKKLTYIVLTFFLSGLISACSQQWREVTPEIDGATLDSFVLEALGQGAQSANTSQFQNLYLDANTRIYYAEGPSEFGSVEGVAAILDAGWDILDTQFTGFTSQASTNNANAVQRVRVFLLESGNKYSILFDLLMSDGRRVVRSFDNVGIGLEGDLLTIDMGHFKLTSFDTDSEGLLNDVIQLELNTPDDLLMGKITTLVAFD